MVRLSKEFLEKMAIEESSSRNVSDYINRELKLLIEEIARRYTK